MDAEAFPFSDCDLDWAWRLRKSGLRQAVIQTSAVVHDNQQQFSSWSASRALHFHRARLRLLESHSTVIKPVITPLLAARHICELAAAAVCFGRGYGLRMRKRAALLARCFNGYA
jgi:GT2 family glycosyltransferase